MSTIKWRTRLALLLAVSLILTLFGCGKNNIAPPVPDMQQENPASSTMASETSEPVGLSIRVTVGKRSFTAALAENDATRAFMARLPLTLTMTELNGNEKYVRFGEALPTAGIRPGSIEAGDLMLYQEDYLVLFYRSFASDYRYTPLGRLDNPVGLAEALGSGDVTVRFESIGK